MLRVRSSFFLCCRWKPYSREMETSESVADYTLKRDIQLNQRSPTTTRMIPGMSNDASVGAGGATPTGAVAAAEAPAVAPPAAEAMSQAILRASRKACANSKTLILSRTEAREMRRMIGGESTPQHTLYLIVLLVGVLIGGLLQGRVHHHYAGASSKPVA